MERGTKTRKKTYLYEASLLRVDPLCPAKVALKKIIRFATFLMCTHLIKAPIPRSPFTDSDAASPAHAKVASAAASLALLSRLLFPLVDRTQDAQLGLPLRVRDWSRCGWPDTSEPGEQKSLFCSDDTIRMNGVTDASLCR